MGLNRQKPTFQQLAFRVVLRFGISGEGIVGGLKLRAVQGPSFRDQTLLRRQDQRRQGASLLRDRCPADAEISPRHER